MLLGMLEVGDLTPDENLLLRVLSATGRVRAPASSSVRGDLVAQIIFGRGPIGSALGTWRRLQFENLTVIDSLDLADDDSQTAVLFTDCCFVDGVDLSRTSLFDVRFGSCLFAGDFVAQNATITHNLLLVDNVFMGNALLTLSYIGGTMSIAGCQFEATQREYSLDLDGARLPGLVRIEQSRFAGGLSIRGAEIGGQATVKEVMLGADRRFPWPEARLALGQSRFGSELILHSLVLDKVACNGIQVSSDLVFSDVGHRDARGAAIALDRARVNGGVVVSGCTLRQGLSLSAAECGQLQLEESEVRASRYAPQIPGIPGRDSDEYCVSGDGVRVRGDVRIGPNIVAMGEVRLLGSDIGGQLQLPRGERGTPLLLNLEESAVRSTVFLDEVSTRSYLHMVACTFATIFVAPNAFPRVSLLRSTYRNINDSDGKALTGEQAVELLAHDPRGAEIAPYRVMARWLSSQGDDRGATRVAIEGERRVRRNSRALRPIYWLWEATVGFGYSPLRALPWFVGLVLLGTILFAFLYGGELDLGLDRPAFARASESPETLFNPLVFATGAVVPGGLYWVDWIPGNPSVEVLTVMLQVAGWLLLTALVAGIANRIRRA